MHSRESVVRRGPVVPRGATDDDADIGARVRAPIRIPFRPPREFAMNDARYVFLRSVPGVWTEIYFPKKAAYQGAIFDALRRGFVADNVRAYLRSHMAELLDEFRDDWPELLDPSRYEGDGNYSARPLSAEDAGRRIDAYASVFFGYSVYSVDGVFYDPETGTEDEEATQVIRILFRFRSAQPAPAPEHKAIFVALCRWLIDYGLHSDERTPWGDDDRDRFLRDHAHWPAAQLAWAAERFRPLALETAKWMDDCGLFLFGYLVRHFSERVLQERRVEEEIWVASFFNSSINLVKRLSRETRPEALNRTADDAGAP